MEISTARAQYLSSSLYFFYLDSRTDFPSSKLFLEKTVLGQCIFDTIPLDLLINY